MLRILRKLYHQPKKVEVPASNKEAHMQHIKEIYLIKFLISKLLTSCIQVKDMKLVKWKKISVSWNTLRKSTTKRTSGLTKMENK